MGEESSRKRDERSERKMMEGSGMEQFVGRGGGGRGGAGKVREIEIRVDGAEIGRKSA